MVIFAAAAAVVAAVVVNVDVVDCGDGCLGFAALRQCLEMTRV